MITSIVRVTNKMRLDIPLVSLNDGNRMPIFGFGTYNALGDEIKEAISDAIDAGYRHFDLAMFYGNEIDIGHAIRHKIQEGVVKRKDLYLVSKLWPTFMNPAKVESTLKKSLNDLQVDYLDLYLIHWPMSFEEGADLLPLEANGRLRCGTADYVDTWKAMEECVRKGLTRSIGISNFNERQVERIMNHCSIKPVNNQIECHLYFTQKSLIDLCQKHGIVVSSYGSLGRPGTPENDSEDPVLLDDPLIQSLAKKYGRTPAHIALRFLTMRNIVVIPKSSSKKRILENIASLEFDISAEDMTLLDGLNRNYRYNRLKFASYHPEFPF